MGNDTVIIEAEVFNAKIGRGMCTSEGYSNTSVKLQLTQDQIKALMTKLKEVDVVKDVRTVNVNVEGYASLELKDDQWNMNLKVTPDQIKALQKKLEEALYPKLRIGDVYVLKGQMPFRSFDHPTTFPNTFINLTGKNDHAEVNWTGRFTNIFLKDYDYVGNVFDMIEERQACKGSGSR